MTAKAAFGPDEWKVVSGAPPSAAMLVVTSHRGGVIRETMAMAKEWAHARGQHGQSELLDELVGERPHADHTRFHSRQEQQDHVVQELHEAMALVREKATPQEAEDYKSFVVTLAEHVAQAHAEDGQAISDEERAAIATIEQALA
jgi:hypothetical protein